VESYRLVEKAKHDAELDHILRSRLGYEDLLDSRVGLNSPIVGYLASARLFLDSTDKTLPELLGPESIDSFKQLKGGIYDGSAEYRFIEALRNYVQHRKLPIHAVTYHDFVEDGSNTHESNLVTSLSLKSDRETLGKDKKFKKDALKGLPETVDIIACIRFHMEGLWQLHDYLITTHSSVAGRAREQMSKYIERYIAETRDTALGLNAVATDAVSGPCETVPVLLDWDDARLATLAKLGNLRNLHRRYVSGKIHRA
jgi:hypothetical protein